MIYLINDVVHDIFNYTKTTTVKIVTSEDEALDFLKEPQNLKQFKGEVRIEKVIL